MGRAGFETSPTLIGRVRDPADGQAWGEFHDRYAPMIRGWCRRWFPREADDMAQEVLFRLVNCLKAFEYQPEKGRFRGYLKTVTHRLMADLKERASEPPVIGGDALFDQVEAPQDLLERLAAEYDLELLDEAKERVRRRVEGRTWSAYVETAERGRRPAKVARELGMSVGAVYQARYSVITELGRQIQELQGPLEER
jgi:RNA polymerase sigma-70 factor (ECF subfamily)